MSLRVWLPLNGDLTNNGLSDVVVTNNGATVDNTGKIGKCYAFSGSSTKLTNVLTTPISSSVGSLACWVKFTSFPANNAWYCLMQLGALGGYAACRLGLYMEYSTGINISIDGSSTATNVYTHSLVANTWYHLCATYDGTTVKLYIDGTQVMSKAVTKSSYTTNASNLFVGGTNNYWFKGSINDARYYDHALSPKEVKLLSQGLVCHYKLSGGGFQENLFYWQNKGKSPITLNTYQNRGSFTQFSRCLTFDASTTVGQTYTISFWARSVNGTTRLQLYNSNSAPRYFYFSTILTETLGSEWQYFTYTFTNQDRGTGATDPGAVNRIEIYMPAQVGGEVKEIKIEKGSTATAWSPAPLDSSYSELGYDENIVYDSSGYNNHAQIWHYDEYGAIVSTSDTTRNSTATYINSANVTTNTASGTWMIYGNCGLTTPNTLTVSLWCKPFAGYGGNVNHGLFCLTSNNIGLSAATDYNTSAMHNRDGYIDMCNSSGTHKTPTITIVKNEWHHYAVVYDGRYGKIYRDATELTTIDMGSVDTLKTFTAIVLGYSHAGGVARSNQSYYSDFRLYATVLSAADIQELYNAPVSVANTGAMLTQGEFVEVAT